MFFIYMFFIQAWGAPLVVGVHSYEQEFPWTRLSVDAFEKGFEKVMKGAEFKHFYLNTKKKPLSLKKKHPKLDKIKSYILEKQPDIVYLTDDYAIHKLHDFLIEQRKKFVFSGLNSTLPQKMTTTKKGFSGVLESSLTASAVRASAEKRISQMSGVTFEIFQSNSFEEWKKRIEMVKRADFDAVLPLLLYSLKDKRGKHKKAEKVFSELHERSPVPIVSTTSWHIQCGGALAVSHTPESHGNVAANIALQVMHGKSPTPERPPHGLIEINNQALEKLGIKVPFELLTSARIHKSIIKPCKIRR